jgi:hypothetical protein
MMFGKTHPNHSTQHNASSLDELRVNVVSDLHHCSDETSSSWMPGGTYCAAERLERVMNTLAQNKADLNLWLGDLVDRGHRDSYKSIDTEISKAGISGDLFVTPGNHDIREALHDKVRSDSPDTQCVDGNRTHYLIKRGKHHIFVLDSAPEREFEVTGAATSLPEFGKVGQEWLRGALDSMEPDAAAWIFTHYPANNFDQSWITSNAIMRDGEDLHALIVAHQSKVGGVFSGHLHHAFFWRRDDINYHSLIPASVALTLDKSEGRVRIVENPQGFPGVEALVLRSPGNYATKSFDISSSP